MMLRGLLTSQPKEEASYNFEMSLSNAENCNNHDDRKRDPDKIKKDPEIELHYLEQDNKIFEETNISIKEEISSQEVTLKKNEDIQVNCNEQFHIETVYIPMANEQTESQTNNIYKIKKEIDIESYTTDYENEAKNLVPEIKVSNVYEHVLEINPQINNINDRINEKRLDVENHTTESYVLNKNEESKLLVPAIKVSNVYDHVLEINPFEYTNFNEQGRDTDSEYESGAPASTEMKLSTEVGRKKRVRESTAKPRKTKAEYQKEYRERQKAKRNENKQERLNITPKTSAERGREFRARKALLRQQIRQQQELDAVLSTEDSQESSKMRRLEKKARHAEATRRWREKKRNSTLAESKNSEESSNALIVQVDAHDRHFSQLGASIASTENETTSDLPSLYRRCPKTAAERMREYRARKKRENPTVNRRKPKKSSAERAQECRARKKAKIHSANSTMVESTNSEESSNAIVQTNVYHRHFSQLGATIISTNNVCVTEDQATSDIPSIECGYPKTAAERVREHRARKKKENPIMKYRKPKKSGAQRMQEYRARKKAKAQSAANNIGNLIEDQTIREQIEEQKSQSQDLFVSRLNQESDNETNYMAYADFHRHLLADALKKKEKVKTPVERSREYRARKKALKNSNQESNSTSETIQEMQENSLSENSQDSDSCPNVSNKRKTPADYSREYRARKKALKNFQKQSDSEDSSLNPVIKPKTPAERSRDYRARKKAYVDLEKPIPIALSIDMLKSKKSCTVDNFSILPDNINDISNDQSTSNCNNNMEGFQDSGTDLHDMLHHMHNYISNKLTEEILTDTEIKKEVCDTEANENIQAVYNEHIQIKTEYTQSPITDLEIEYQIEDKHNEMIVENEIIIKKCTDSVNENMESKLLAPEIGVSNIYDHVLEIKQEIPREFTNFDDNQNIDCGALNNGTNLQEDFRIKRESESFKDT